MHLGLSFADVAGISATLSDIGLTAEIGSRAVLTAFTKMNTESEKMAKIDRNNR